MINPQSICTPIPLEGIYNARDLGGHPSGGGKATVTGRLIRSATPAHMTRRDLEALLGLGVNTVIDLRNRDEEDMEPNPFAKVSKVSLHRVPLLELQTAPHLLDQADMGGLYIHILEHGANGIARALRIILSADGCVLFHCSAGKDRTGVLAALLLLLAGVDKERVTEEYECTRIFLKPWIDKVLAEIDRRGAKVNLSTFDANPEYIRKAINHIDGIYGGADGYMREIGISSAEIDGLKQRLLDASL